MNSLSKGSIRLFRVGGIAVFVHWSWFLFAVYEIKSRSSAYTSVTWNAAEYVGLFLIVMLHEFGHALACRQVGGTANQIVLWPLGGVAYVNPPPRPGATLWSIAAGPLVNVLLVPVLSILVIISRWAGGASTQDVHFFLRQLWLINLILLVFNILPIFPLDGGQILRSLLWYVMGRARSLMVATAIGFMGVAGFFLLALWSHSIWLGVLSLFILMNCWQGLQQARLLARSAELPRYEGFACPSCKTAPPIGHFWRCARCEAAFDTFQSGAKCPNCAAEFPTTNCPECGKAHPMQEWMSPAFTASRS
jgi:Zn-dependent protease